MSEVKVKTLRHIETVRNFLNACIKELLNRQEQHDQSKLEEPEASMFEIFTHKLRDMEYGSAEYKQCLIDMGSALQHHYENNRHHAEFHKNGINDMTLIDLIEMLCDWKASGMRHDTGDLIKSIEINKDRFKIDNQLYTILMNTAQWLNEQKVYHKANES